MWADVDIHIGYHIDVDVTNIGIDVRPMLHIGTHIDVDVANIVVDVTADVTHRHSHRCRCD